MKNLHLFICLISFYLFPVNLDAQSLHFDGVDDYVVMPNATQYIDSDPFGYPRATLSAWIKPEKTGAHQHICGIRHAAINDFYFHQKSDNGLEARFINAAGTAYNIDYYPGLNQGEWNHLVMTYNGSTLKLYHNAVEVASIPASGIIASQFDNGDFTMGAWGNTSFFFQGELDEVSLWSIEIPLSRVQDLYNKNPYTQVFGTPRLYYKFNQGTANGNNAGVTSLVDTEGNLNGTLNNFALSGTTSNWVDESNPDLVVTNTNTSGFGSLRAAIDDANNTAGSQTITFNIPGTGPHTIPATTNYELTDNGTIIDGRTQPGYADTPIIFLDGGNIQNTCFDIYGNNIEIYGLNIQNNPYAGIFLQSGSSNNTIGNSSGGNIISNFGDSGILADGSTNNIITYNQIGIDENGVGTTLSSAAIWLQSGSDNFDIGHNTIGCGNVSNSYDLITIGSSNNNSIYSNYIGTDENGGDYGIDNQSGIEISSSSNNTISTNTIANNDYGIFLFVSAQYTNLFQNNYFCNTTKAIRSNQTIAPPVILTANESSITGTATYNSDYAVIELYLQNDENCSGTACQGEYIVEISINPDGTWTYQPSQPILPGQTYAIKTTIGPTINNTEFESSEMACITILCSPTPPIGDVVSDPIIIGAQVNYSHTKSTTCHTNTLGNTSKDVLYRFTTLPCVDSVFISTCEGTEFNTVLRLFDNTGTQIELNNDACGTQSEINRTDLNPDEDYIIAVEGGAGESGVYTLNFRQTFATDNNNYNPTSIGNGLSNPYLITIPYSGTDNTQCYTDSIGNSSADVFYQFTLGECIDSVSISTCNSDFDTYLRLLDATGTEIDDDDDDCTGTRSLIETTTLVAGETYTVVVEGFSANEGAFSLDIETFNGEAAPGDSLSTAIVIPSFPFTTTDSTDNPCLNNTLTQFFNGNDIIYQFTTSECHEKIDIDISYNTSSNPSHFYHLLDSFGNNYDPLNSESSSFYLESNTTYYLAIQPFSNQYDDYTFTFTINETAGVGNITGDDINNPIVIDNSYYYYSSNILNQADCFTNSVGNISNDVFFQFTTKSCVDTVSLSTCLYTDFNTLIRLLDENGNQLAINYNGCGIQSELISTDLSPNTTYYAVVEGNSGQSGNFLLQYRETELGNNIINGPNGVEGNTFENPFIVTSLPYSVNGNTDDCLYAPSSLSSSTDHFYQFTTNSCPSEYTISTCGLNDFNTSVTIYDSNKNYIDGLYSCSQTITDLSPNTTYIIQVDGGFEPEENKGNYNLSISSVAIGPNTVVYVDQSASGNNDGTTWTNAYTDLQDALANMTNCGNEIWIASGTYYTASPGSGRSATFNIDKNVAIYGGFAGGETDVASRDIINNIVELSGDIDDDGTWANNSFHTVKVDNATVILDGLTIKDGAANDTPFARARGGGLFVKEANLQLVDCTLTNNNALFGGAMFATLSDVTITGSTIIGNEANYGAALYHSNENNMYIKNTRIIDNNSIIRCAVEVNNSNYTSISNSVIANNTAANANAIGIISTNRDVQCDIYNSTIIGGTKNRALITLQVGYGDQLDMNILNSIVAHQNPNFNKNVVAFNNNILNLNTEYSYIQGSSIIGASNNNLYSNIDGGLMLETDGSYALMPCSPAVDAGSDDYIIDYYDIVGNYRGFTPDMGAYEVQANCTVTREASDIEVVMETVEPEFAISKIYPNPASNVLNVEFEISSEEDVQISVMDMTGKIIMNKTIQSMKGQQVETLDVSRLTAGYYIVNLQTGKERISQKFVKM